MRWLGQKWWISAGGKLLVMYLCVANAKMQNHFDAINGCCIWVTGGWAVEKLLAIIFMCCKYKNAGIPDYKNAEIHNSYNASNGRGGWATGGGAVLVGGYWKC